MKNFDRFRETSSGDLVAWAKNEMTKRIRLLEEHAEEIGEVGKDAIVNRIEELDRIADPHKAYDGDQSMIDGVQVLVTPSKLDDMVNIKVGWDLSKYRHGYPQLQDQGFEGVVGMEALTLGSIAMRTRIQRLLDEGS